MNLINTERSSSSYHQEIKVKMIDVGQSKCNVYSYLVEVNFSKAVSEVL